MPFASASRKYPIDVEAVEVLRQGGDADTELACLSQQKRQLPEVVGFVDDDVEVAL